MIAQTVRDAAVEYLERGWSVIPVDVYKRPLLGPGECKPFMQTAATREQICEWWEKWPEAGIGVYLGAVSGVVRLDADGGDLTQKAIELVGSIETAEFVTPSGGRGWLFSYNERLNFGREVLEQGTGKHEELRIQANSCYTVVPPSAGYEWVRSEPIVQLPPALMEMLLGKRAEKMVRMLSAQLSPVIAEPDMDVVLEALASLNPERAKNYDDWIAVGMALQSTGNDAYLEHWIEWSKKSDNFEEGKCESMWDGFKRYKGKALRTIRTLLKHAKDDGWKPRRMYEPLTGVGNGRVLAKACNNFAVYCAEWEKWLVWDGMRWARDIKLQIVELSKKVVRDRYYMVLESLTKISSSTCDAATKKQKFATINKVLIWCMKSESANSIEAAVRMARSDPRVLINHEVLDDAPWLFNCVNGTLNLRDGQLREHRQSDMLTHLCPTEYHDDAICPRWMQFLDEVFCGDAELIRWTQKLFGYCLTGLTVEHMLPILYGTGRNGKSTMLEMLAEMLGRDYSTSCPPGFLLKTRYEQHPTGLTVLYGKRFATDIETGEGSQLNEEMIKKLTGGDRIEARRMREDFWGFTPTHKLLLATNYAPKVEGLDVAIWSRLKLVPFKAEFLGDADDKFLKDKLRAEFSGILRWMVEGCKRWQLEGLGESPAVAEATAAYRTDQDTVRQFFAECCEVSATDKVKKAEVIGRYKAWCTAYSMRGVSNKALGTEILKLCSGSDNRYYFGIKVT